MHHSICWQDVGVLVPKMSNQQGQRHESCPQQPLNLEEAGGADHEHGSVHIVLRIVLIDGCQQVADGKCHDPCQQELFLQETTQTISFQLEACYTAPTAKSCVLV